MKCMKTTISICLALFSLLPQALSQQSLSEARQRMLLSGDELLTEATSIVQTKSLEELRSIVRDNNASPGVRSASARLLLQRAEKSDDKQAALPALGIYLPSGLPDTESDWTKNYPVAAEAALHPDMMPQIIQGALSGELAEPVAGFVLLRYQSDKVGPQEHLAELLKTTLAPDQRQRCERLLAVLKGETGAGTSNNQTNQPSENIPTPRQPPIVQPPTSTMADEAKQTQPARSGEPPSSTPWSTIVALIVAAGGLLWLLKRRS